MLVYIIPDIATVIFITALIPTDEPIATSPSPQASA